MQNKIETVLIPVDFSMKSQNAIKMALFIATRHHAKVILFHSLESHFLIDRTGKQVIGQETINENYDKIERSMKEIEMSLIDQSPDLEFQTIIRNDNLVFGINEIIDEQNVDLIVCGTSGTQKFTQLVLGSLSYEILNGVYTSVLLVPENCNKYTFDKILVPVRVLDDLTEKVDLSVAIAKKNNGIISLLGICSDDDLASIKEVYQEIRGTLVKNDLEYHAHFLLTKDKATHISKFSKEDGADIIILNYQDEDKWKSFFSENFFKQMINNTNIPLLFLKNREKIKNINPGLNVGYDITLPSPG